MTKQQTTKDITFASTFAVLTAVAAFLLATVGVVVVSTKDNASSVTASGPTTIEVKLSEFKIDMSPATAPAGEITLHVTNAGAQIHNLDIAQLNKKTADIAPGAAATLDLGQVPAGSYDVICAIPGHADAGMKTTLVVGGGSGASTGSTMAGMTMSGGATTAGNPPRSTSPPRPVPSSPPVTPTPHHPCRARCTTSPSKPARTCSKWRPA
jgi:uncharacterized cupredoxin-like copper-binding protein